MKMAFAKTAEKARERVKIKRALRKRGVSFNKAARTTTLRKKLRKKIRRK